MFSVTEAAWACICTVYIERIFVLVKMKNILCRTYYQSKLHF